MVRRLCGNSMEWRCDICNKRVARYTTLGGWWATKRHYRVECGCPQCDQSDSRHFCSECWATVKDNIIKRFNLSENEIELIKKWR